MPPSEIDSWERDLSSDREEDTERHHLNNPERPMSMLSPPHPSGLRRSRRICAPLLVDALAKLRKWGEEGHPREGREHSTVSPPDCADARWGARFWRSRVPAHRATYHWFQARH